MKKIRWVFLASALLAAPAVARADVVVHNLDGRSWHLAVRHTDSVMTTDLPARASMVLDDDATSIQLRDARGEPVGQPMPVADGDRFTLKRGKILRASSQ